MSCVILLNKEATCRNTLEVCWYSEYLHIDRVVNEGDTVQICQKIGTIADITAFDPHLHFGIGDGDPDCWYDPPTPARIIGNLLNFDDFFCSLKTGPIPHIGERSPLPGPTSTFFTAEQIQYVKCKTQSYNWIQGRQANRQIAPQLPIDINQGDWKLFYGSAYHYGCEYYALDWFFEPFDRMIGTDVFCACGGCDVNSVVVFARTLPGGLGDLVIIQHSNYPSCEVPPLPSSFWDNLEDIEVCRHNKTLLRVENPKQNLKLY
jgi:hypothetical protein